MIRQIMEVPSNIVAFQATGDVIKEDFEKVVFPAVQEVVDREGVLNFLLLLETEASNFTFGAWLEEAVLGLKEFFKWRRVAIVTDSESIIRFTLKFSIFAPGVFKGFLLTEFDQAVEWVAGQD